ncbi:hypothetical protein [Cellulomonas sp. NPDC058312]|uniref:hypothetical protein n=1 Tax=Cellulomonas sp. NPDC058312 TaxID=3346441 RepID=UPI0036E74A38
MSDQRHPDHGVPEVCGAAATEVDRLADALAQASWDVNRYAGDADEHTWSGQGADAFRETVADTRRRADAAVDSWGRVSEALTTYARRLAQVQDEADGVRSRLRVAEDDLEDHRRRLVRAKAEVLSGDGTSAGRVVALTRLIAETQRTIDARLLELDEIGRDRARQDQRTAADLLDAAGPGAQAWAGVAFRGNGTQRPVAEVVAEVLRRLRGGRELTGRDHDLVAQLLALYSSDPEVMSAFVAGLGPAGLVGLMNSFAATGGGGFPRGEVAATDLAAALATGLATASRTWPPAEQHWFGRTLVDATGTGVTDHPGADVVGVQVVAHLLSVAGLAPRVALGALERVEEIRVHDPDRFALLTHTSGRHDAGSGVFAHRSISLAASVFAQVARIPDDALDFFASRPAEVTTYWFGEHDWSGNRFAAPAAVLDAVVNSPTSRAAHHSVPVGDAWVTVTGFASRAFEALGGNLALRAGTVSPDAARGIAAALGAYAGETAAGLVGVAEPGLNAHFFTIIGPDGMAATAPRLDVSAGNLSRLLGIATLDPGALAVYGSHVAEYATRVRDHLTGPTHPTAGEAAALLGQVGALYGLTYASYSLEGHLQAQEVSDRARRDLDAILTVAALVPGFSTGSGVVDYLAQLAQVGLGQVGAARMPGVLADGELDAVIDRGLDSGQVAMAAFADALTAGWDQIDPPYTRDDGRPVPAAEVVGQLALDYGTVASAYSNRAGSAALDVRVLGEDQPRNRGAMP